MKDSVGVAEVIALGLPGYDDLKYYDLYANLENDGLDLPELQRLDKTLKVGDLVAYIPFTDAIIPEGLEKRNIFPYKNIMAVATSDEKADK